MVAVTIQPNKTGSPTASAGGTEAVGGAAVSDKMGEIFVSFKREVAEWPSYDGPPPPYDGPPPQSHEAPPPYDGPPPQSHEAPPPYDGPPPTYGEEESPPTRGEDNFFVELKREYGEEAVDYVNRRFSYHYQKPPDYKPTQIDKKLLEVALHNYRLTDKVAEKVAKEHGQDNAWQGLFEVTDELGGGFDGIFAEKLDEAKLLQRVKTATAKLEEGMAKPREEDEQAVAFGFFRLPMWVSHNRPDTGIIGGTKAEQASREVKVVRTKPENLSAVMERIYRSHLRTMRLFNDGTDRNRGGK